LPGQNINLFELEMDVFFRREDAKLARIWSEGNDGRASWDDPFQFLPLRDEKTFPRSLAVQREARQQH
jgi:hypothetical protein